MRLLLILAVAMSAFDANPQPTVPLPGESGYTLSLEPFATHSGINAMDLTHANDGSSRVFVSTQSGQVFVYSAQGEPLGTFLDLSITDPHFEFDPQRRIPFKGLMYIAFHPDYANPTAPGAGRFYTCHAVRTTDSPADFDDKDFGNQGTDQKRFAIAEWQANPDNPDRIDPASYRQVMLVAFRGNDRNPHGLGQIKFNPLAKPGEADYGKLYIAVGDGENGNYDETYNLDRVQQPDNPYGKILRIDPLARGGKPYTIPEDNPFKSVTEDGSERPSEAYAIGLRDPQWFSFAKDLEGQDVLIVSDIGHLLVEEINIIRPGGNYGWDRFEGLLDFDTDRELQGQARPPVVHYGHAIPARIGAKPEGGLTAIMGGLVVSDPGDPSFQGQILFGDLPRGTLMHANYHHALTVEQSGRQSTPYIMTVKLGDKTGNVADVLGAERGDARFGFDEANNVYLVSKRTGTIFKTGLVFTGEPVKSDPHVSKPGVINNTMGILVTVGGVALLLVVILVLVIWGAKRKRV